MHHTIINWQRVVLEGKSYYRLVRRAKGFFDYLIYYIDV